MCLKEVHQKWHKVHCKAQPYDDAPCSSLDYEGLLLKTSQGVPSFSATLSADTIRVCTKIFSDRPAMCKAAKNCFLIFVQQTQSSDTNMNPTGWPTSSLLTAMAVDLM